MVDFNSVLNAARQLTEDDQQRLIDALWNPIEESDVELDASWQAEIERRVARMEAGETTSIPWEQVRAESRQLLGLSGSLPGAPDGD